MANIDTRWLNDHETGEIFYPMAHEKAVVCGENNDKTLDAVLAEKAEVSEVNKVKETLTESGLTNVFDGAVRQGYYSAVNGAFNSNTNDTVANTNPIDCTGKDTVTLLYEEKAEQIRILFYNGNTYLTYNDTTNTDKNFAKVPVGATKFNFAITNNITPQSTKKIKVHIDNEVYAVDNRLSDVKMLGWSTPKECPVQNSVSGNVFMQRVGRYPLWECDWLVNSGNFFANDAILRKIGSTNAYCTQYQVGDAEVSSIAGGIADKTIYFQANNNNRVIVKDSSYTDVESFKTALKNANAYLYYELATPVTKVVDGNEVNEWHHIADVNLEVTALGYTGSYVNLNDIIGAKEVVAEGDGIQFHLYNFSNANSYISQAFHFVSGSSTTYDTFYDFGINFTTGRCRLRQTVKGSEAIFARITDIYYR